MWRRTYLLLLLVRIYFALSPSYIHPDENFQGPELFAGRLFSYPSLLTWEFTSEAPVRSIFPLWLVYGLPMTLLKWLWAETGNGNPPPQLIYYVLRLTMFLLSLILEDWAIHELLPNPRRRRQAVVLVASCYVTWTYQTHTFSNSLETLLVLWSLVLIQRIVENKHRSSLFTCAFLSLVAVIGVFNRITFPAFIVIPALQLVPHFINKPFSFISLAFFGLLFSFFAIAIDTTFYASPQAISDFVKRPIITPLNNLLYNSNSANLAQHGLHARYQHFLVNFPLLLGPAYIVPIWSALTRRAATSPAFHFRSMRAYSAICGAAVISIFPHQEARFLMPCVPLFLTCCRPPKSRVFLASWVLFNVVLGALMGIYHQGGVVPAQIHIPALLADSIPLPETPDTNRTVTVLWWKTYSPPLWLLGENPRADLMIETRDLKGISRPEFHQQAINAVPQCVADTNPFEFVHGMPKIKVDGPLTLLVAPRSNPYLDQFIIPDGGVDEAANNRRDLRLHKLWQYDRHVNLDDFDPGDDGLVVALKQVFGRYGLAIWLVTRPC